MKKLKGIFNIFKFIFKLIFNILFLKEKENYIEFLIKTE